MTKRTIIYAVGFVILWNSGFVGAEYGLPYTGPFTLLFWRYAMLALLLFAYLIIRRRFWWPGWSKAGTHMLVGVLAHGVWLSCVLLALDQEVPAGIVALVVALQPLATGAFSGLVVGEPTPLHRWLGLIIGFAGVAIIVLSRMDINEPASVFGYLIPLGSVIAITVASLIQRRMEVMEEKMILPVDLEMFYQCMATALVTIVPAFFLENFTAHWEPPFIYTMIWLILAVSLGSYLLMWLLLKQESAPRVASLFYLGPPVTMLMTWIFFGDKLQSMDILGLLVVLAGILLTQMKLKSVKIPKKST